MKRVAVTCNLCGRDSWRVRFPANMNGMAPDLQAFRCTSNQYGHHPQIVECCYCGYVYANPRWVAGELLEAYQAVEDEAYLREREGREQTFTRHLAALQRFAGPPQGRLLLDVGAYIGVFVAVAREAGWEAWGVEPSSWAVQVAHGQKLPIIQGTQHLPELKERQFDVITMWDVIEHVDDPAGELARSYELLKPGGWLAVHTMDVDSLMARLMGHRWPWLMDMHIHYFSQRTLSQMLYKQGFEVIWSGAQGRYLRLGYLATRVKGINSRLGQLLYSLVTRAGAGKLTIPVNFGDLFTVYARRPVE